MSFVLDSSSGGLPASVHVESIGPFASPRCTNELTRLHTKSLDLNSSSTKFIGSCFWNLFKCRKSQGSILAEWLMKITKLWTVLSVSACYWYDSANTFALDKAIQIRPAAAVRCLPSVICGCHEHERASWPCSEVSHHQWSCNILDHSSFEVKVAFACALLAFLAQMVPLANPWVETSYFRIWKEINHGPWDVRAQTHTQIHTIHTHTHYIL